MKRITSSKLPLLGIVFIAACLLLLPSAAAVAKAIDATSKTQRLELPDDTTAIGTRDRRVRRPRCRALH